MSSDFIVGVIDVGAPKNIGWAILHDNAQLTGHSLDEFIRELVTVADGRPVALGFEAPMFIPIGREVAKLTAQRNGERGRPWSAGAGATVTTIGLAIVCHVLARLRAPLSKYKATVDWRAQLDSDSLLLFEAFVSGANHAAVGEHEIDALNAAQAFANAYPNLDEVNAVQETQVLSLVGTCMLRTGWLSDARDALNQPCLVIRP